MALEGGSRGGPAAAPPSGGAAPSAAWARQKLTPAQAAAAGAAAAGAGEGPWSSRFRGAETVPVTKGGYGLLQSGAEGHVQPRLALPR
eukprot:CAMPEP_0172611376 /NCGR_PEP_ID=MMETSP1068-20121228/31076_1 /TAXON_ID=35684 /ORGANISM="Pseudopedinella elastica, Strain CCMP716" /LENGTH=87 /DNA_ID=CAMNT_0013415335 /DNA_START=397 /DNA_END=662 /DNA_ORIENTATION=-